MISIKICNYLDLKYFFLPFSLFIFIVTEI